MKAKAIPKDIPNFDRRRLVMTSILVLILLSVCEISSAQSSSDPEYLKHKALLFKNRVEYDSALAYYLKLDDAYRLQEDIFNRVNNQVEICDILILQRQYLLAKEGLDDAGLAIHTSFPSDTGLISNFFQVLGSYFLSTGSIDSAKYYLNMSVMLRTGQSGPADTLLHYAINKLGNLYLSISSFDSAFIYYKSALELSLIKKNPVNYLSASSYQNLGISAHMKGDYQFAENCYLNSLKYKEILFNYNDPGLAKIYWTLGKFYSDQSKYDIALEYYEKAEILLANKYDRDYIDFARIYWNKGNLYTHKGDYSKATNYLSKAYSILTSNLKPYDFDVLKVLLDLGFAYDKKGDSQLAIEYYYKAAKNKNDAGIIKIYRNLGNLYQKINLPDSAQKYYLLSIDFAKKIYSGNSYDLALCYQYYGEFKANKLERDDSSLWYYEQAAIIFKQLFGGKNKDLSKVYCLQSEYFLIQGHYDSALIKVQNALIALQPNFSSNNPEFNPNISDVNLDIYLIDALSLKALIYYKIKQVSLKNQDLLNSLECVYLTLDVADNIRKTYIDEASQIILNNEVRSIIDLGVVVAYELFKETKQMSYISIAYNFSEKGKAIILLSALRGLEAKSASNLPGQVSKLENILALDIANYDKLLYMERQKNNPDDSRIKFWSDQVFSLRLQQDSLLLTIRQSNPEYFRLKYDYSTISADSALFSLDSDQAIIEYHIADSLVFGFILADNKINVKKLCSKSELKSRIDSLQQYFLRKDFFNAGQDEFNAIATLSNDLYEILIWPFEKEITGKRLIIVPDGELGYLSFDLLLKEKPEINELNYKTLQWLIRSNPLSYSSSATIFFEQMKHKAGKVNGNVLAFAPSYNYNASERNSGNSDSALLNLIPMVGTKEEINSISDLFKTRRLFDNQATETNFKEIAGKYSILHLAMHTIIDDQNPLYSRLVFTMPEKNSGDDGYLNTYELFGLPLSGQLAVLSACNTGSGKLERGEGIISLARGFFYAGIPSVVMTLWEVEDHSSADLVALFYKNLRDGYATDIALQKAKLEFLEKAGQLQSHPYFWAGYVNIGKTKPISFQTSWNTISLVVLIASIVSAILIIYFFINNRVFFTKKRH